VPAELKEKEMRRLFSVLFCLGMILATTTVHAEEPDLLWEPEARTCPATGTHVWFDGWRGKFTVDGVDGVHADQELVMVVKHTKILVREVREADDTRPARAWRLNKSLPPGCWRVIMAMPPEGSGFMTVTYPRPGPDSDGTLRPRKSFFFISEQTGEPVPTYVVSPYNLSIMRLNDRQDGFYLEDLFTCPGVCIQTIGIGDDYIVNRQRLREGEIWRFPGDNVTLEIQVPETREIWRTSAPLRKGFWQLMIHHTTAGVDAVWERWQLSGPGEWVARPEIELIRDGEELASSPD